ncbi:MAG: aminopeptidase N [Planctomycetota bacterium]|jgi:aminopeptidase N
MLFQFLQVLPLALGSMQIAAGDEATIDLREQYDVLAYDLELVVQPATKTLEGLATISARSEVEALNVVQLDLYDFYDVLSVTQGADELKISREGNSLSAMLSQPVASGNEFNLKVHYRGKPEGGPFDGFHWTESADGSPWINTACQGLGAHYWYPCKASFFHPEDKPERVSMAITCPADLYAVSNGRLSEVAPGAPAWFSPEKATSELQKTYRWRHNYPLETYAVTLNVGPYVVVEKDLNIRGIDYAVPFIYYVLPENAEKAALQFQEVPQLVRIYSGAFGPFPFPDSKFGLVETNFWGMEHSTAIAYGSSYPTWCKENGVKDKYAGRNKWFDYILIHEVAHEWWGNAVSAEHWGHFWLHEGFGTYAEGVYVEFTAGREDADRYFKEKAERIPESKGSLYRGDSPTSGEAYNGLIYSKGACVLNTLRHYLDDDELWWKSVREFNMSSRYGNSTTEDFITVLDKNTGKPWKQFFDEWFYGEGTPRLTGSLRSSEKAIEIHIDNANGTFHVPIDIAWSSEGQEHNQRLWLDPGESSKSIAVTGTVSELRIEHLDRLLGKHEVTVEN